MYQNFPSPSQKGTQVLPCSESVRSKPDQKNQTKGLLKENTRLKPSYTSLLEWKIIFLKTALPPAEMFNVILIQEGKASRILGITKPTSILGPDVQLRLHLRKWMFYWTH